MRLEAKNISTAQYCSLLVGGFILTNSLVQIPMSGANVKLLLGALAGLLVLPFLEVRFALRYRSCWLVLAGAAGLLALLVDRFGPLLGNPRFLRIETRTTFVAGILYAVCLFSGLILIKQDEEKAKRRKVVRVQAVAVKMTNATRSALPAFEPARAAEQQSDTPNQHCRCHQKLAAGAGCFSPISIRLIQGRRN